MPINNCNNIKHLGKACKSTCGGRKDTGEGGEAGGEKGEGDLNRFYTRINLTLTSDCLTNTHLFGPYDSLLARQ